MNRDIIKKSNRIFPWFGGLSADLLFFIAIDTLYLTIVKGLSAAQVVSLTTISLVVCILLQIPILKIIHHIGNTRSTRLGVFLLLCASIMLTFGNNYGWMIGGKIIYEVAFSFKNMDSGILKNNLGLLHKGDEAFVLIKNRANTVYSTITAIIAFTVSFIFNYNNMLPMYLCIGFCILSMGLSFFVRDFSENKKRKHINDAKHSLKFTKFIILALIIYALFCPLLDSGQNNGKLFIQQELLDNYTVALTASYLTFIVAISRVVRIISNLTFSKIFLYLKDKVLIYLCTGLALSLIFMLAGYSVSSADLNFKFILMGIGYIILLAIRDPLKTYMQDLVLSNSDEDDQQSALIYMELCRKIIAAIFNIIASAMLLKVALLYVIILTLILSILEIVIAIRLYILVTKKK